MAVDLKTLTLTTLGASRADELSRIQQAGLVADGRVFLLSLEAVRRELGPRWGGRHDLVWETAERALTRSMPLPDVFFRVDEATILAAISSADAYQGHVRCAEVMRSVLSHFLGREAQEDLRIDRLLSFDGGSLSCAPVDLGAGPPAVRPPAAGAPGQGKSPRWTPPPAGRPISTVLQTERHGSMPMTLEVTPVWRLDRGIISAYAFRRRLPVRPEELTDADRELAAHLTLDQLFPVLEDYRRVGGAFAIILPCALSVISARRSRLALLDRCTHLAEVMRKVVILEIEGIVAGAPAGRINETAAMMRPFVLALTVGVNNAPEARSVVREFPFNGIAINGRGVPCPRLQVLTLSAKQRTGNVIVHDAPAEIDSERLRAWGASHATWRGPAGLRSVDGDREMAPERLASA